MKAWKHAWITGASSGIGAELAVSIAATGTMVSASARSAGKLLTLSQRQAGILPLPLDVSDPAAVKTAVAEAEQAQGPIDLAILNAGVWMPSEPDSFNGEAAAKSMDVNYLGVTHALAAVVPQMIERKAGHIVIVASVAGYSGLPKGAYYAPTKAALINLAESLHPELEQHGIKVQLVNPGFIKTPMTKVNTFPMPFLMELPDAVKLIMNGLASNRFEIAFPWQLARLLKLMRMLPYWLYFWLVRRLRPRS